MKLSYDRLHELFEYLESGWLRRKTGPRTGKIAGCENPSDGYVYVVVDKKLYAAHQMIWCMHKGYWPLDTIDHKDRVRINNRINNLRDTTQSKNLHNRKAKGVRQIPSGVWEARVCVNYLEMTIGYYATEELALEARTKYKEQLK